MMLARTHAGGPTALSIRDELRSALVNSAVPKEVWVPVRRHVLGEPLADRRHVTPGRDHHAGHAIRRDLHGVPKRDEVTALGPVDREDPELDRCIGSGPAAGAGEHPSRPSTRVRSKWMRSSLCHVRRRTSCDLSPRYPYRRGSQARSNAVRGSRRLRPGPAGATLDSIAARRSARQPSGPFRTHGRR